MIYHQYTADGYYVGPIEGYDLQPNNSTREAPNSVPNYLPRWTGTGWEQVEDHRGERGYLNRSPFTIESLGPYPEGFSLTEPEPTEEEKAAARASRLREERNRRLAETDYLMMRDYPLTEEEERALMTYRQALRDLPSQDGAPWDGGGEFTPWPTMPIIEKVE